MFAEGGREAAAIPQLRGPDWPASRGVLILTAVARQSRFSNCGRGIWFEQKPAPYFAADRCCQVAAYSTQSDKVINSGEGGFLTTGDDEIAARAIYLAGAYERRYGEKRRQGRNSAVNRTESRETSMLSFIS